jgi:Tol biopolymer transport system component
MGSRRRSRRAFAYSFFLVASFGVRAHAQSIVRIDVANDGSETPGGVTSVDVSADGTKVVFASDAYGLDPADVNYFRDVLVRDLAAGTTTLVSTRSNGRLGDGHSDHPRISADGRIVAFESDATDLVGMDRNGKRDVFVKELATGITKRVSVASDGTEADGASAMLAISADGHLVLFSSAADNLVAGDTNGWADVFLRDLAAGTTVRVSTASDGTEVDYGADGGDLTPDGRFLVLSSFASNLVPGDTNWTTDTFVKDLTTGAVVRASVDANGAELTDGSYSFVGGSGAITTDGRRVFFATLDGIDANDTKLGSDVYVRDLDANTTTPISLDSDGAFSPLLNPYYGSFPRAVSADGRFVLFDSSAAYLVSTDGNPDLNEHFNVFIRDRDRAMTTRQSNAFDGARSDGTSDGARMTPDGLRVAFVSNSTNLIDGDPTAGSCAFLVTRQPRDASSNNYGTGIAGTHGVPGIAVSGPPWLNAPIDLVVDNSLGRWTSGLLVIGTESADLPTGFGGDLLVAPLWTPFVAIDPGGLVVSAKFPPLERFASSSLFVQVLEFDPGAVEGVSFTAGLELRGGF